MLCTGIEDIAVNKQNAVIFDNTKCPFCGYELDVISKPLKDKYVNIRYECPVCNTYFPMRRDAESLSNPLPFYDKRELYSFLREFRRLKGD